MYNEVTLSKILPRLCPDKNARVNVFDLRIYMFVKVFTLVRQLVYSVVLSIFLFFIRCDVTRLGSLKCDRDYHSVLGSLIKRQSSDCRVNQVCFSSLTHNLESVTVFAHDGRDLCFPSIFCKMIVLHELSSVTNLGAERRTPVLPLE